MKPIVLFQLILIIFQFQDVVCKVSNHDTPFLEGHENLAMRSTIFDNQVLGQVKTLFTGSVKTLPKTTSETGQKKSIITTADMENSLHVKIDPNQFGNALLNQANENAARKSEIFMNKAIDATALGVAVLKLIFGKDAKMVMKDGEKTDDTKASIRTDEPRPKITSWTHDKAETAERKSLKEDGKIKSKESDGVGKLSMNILKLVKSLQPLDDEKTAENGETKSIKENSEDDMIGQEREKSFSGTESNLKRLLSLIEESKTKEKRGDKKSWVLLNVPSNQPKDELGMLTDPVATEENSDDTSQHDHTEKNDEIHHKKKNYHTKKSSKGLITKIQDQVKHLADIVSKQTNGEKESFIQTKHHIQPNTGQQSYEGKSFTTSRRIASKTLKSEPFQEVNAVKTDTTSYENSVKNLLKALEKSAKKHSLKHVSRHEDEGSDIRPRHHKINLVPVKTKEEQASSKDVVGGTNTAGGAVVSLDALRQLGQLLGLSSQQSDEKNISPYTGTQDTLTLATAMPPEALQALNKPAPTVPPVPPAAPPASPAAPPAPPAPSLENTDNSQNSLTRISEQLKMFAERGLRGHNDYRKLHRAEPLKWSEDLASAAEKLAYQAAKKGSTRRSELVEGKGYGENVAMIANTVLENAGEEATRHWYNEKQNFTFSDPVINEQTKAFTQMIWKGTQTLGMGAAKDDDTGELYVVALYSPKGNDQATLRENLAADGKQHHDVYASIFKKSFAARHE